MTTFLAASRRFGASKGSFTVAAVAGVATASCHDWRDTSDCETARATLKNGDAVNLKTRMTSIGKFSLDSETTANPSIPTFFVALVGETPFTARSFTRLWKSHDMEQRHPRFHSKVSLEAPGYLEPTEDPVEKHVKETLVPAVYRSDLIHRLQTYMTSPIHVWDALWQVEIASGSPLGSSGAISQRKTNRIRQQHPDYQESLILFRGHHALADGVSLVAAFSDLCDEAQEIHGMVLGELERRRKSQKSLTFLQRLARRLKMLIWMCYGSIQAIMYQLHLLWTTPDNPFDFVKRLLPPEETNTVGRSISWCDAAPLDQVKEVARSMGKNVTINDVFVSCVTYAVAKQLDEHRKYLAFSPTVERYDENALPLIRYINVAIPVHLGGGVLLPGKSIGNNIGAFVARVPGEGTVSSNDRLRQVHDSLYWAKRTPAPLISFAFAKLASSFPSKQWMKRIFQSSNANACVAITNVRSSPTKLHMDGHTVESMAGFLPLPPGIPIGCAIQSYAGTVSLTVAAEPWAVPNADRFLEWVLEEYLRLVDDANRKDQKH